MAADPLLQMLADPERTPLRGALPVVTVRPDDDPAYLDAVRRIESMRIDLQRRGSDHGTIVELLRPDLSPSVSTRDMQQCWKRAEPFVMRATAPTANEVIASLPEAWSDNEATTWQDWLSTQEAAASTPSKSFVDPERDLAKRVLNADAWTKLCTLSTAPNDPSRRQCFGVGTEIEDDDHPDHLRHEAVWAWACALYPALEYSFPPSLRATLNGAAGKSLAPSNPILYWNRPNGGALFHHDALPGYLPADAPHDGSGTPSSGQRGVIYVQGHGNTVWLALSIEALAERCCEFIRDVIEGGAPWLFATWVEQEVWQPLFFATREPSTCLAALGQSDAGPLRPLVHGCFEFTGLLIDSGHAAVLHPGDAIALPNHGPERTAMHSVYCGSEGPNIGFSIGLRES